MKNTKRANLIKLAHDYVDDGQFVNELTPLIAIKSESTRQDCYEEQLAYLNLALRPMLEKMGFACHIIANPVSSWLPALFAERIEDKNLPTILTYGHGDVLWGMEGDWDNGRSPWQVDVKNGRVFGRGTVDNKGQHLINFAAARLLIEQQGALGFNLKILIESGEESGSSGLKEIVEQNKTKLAADVFISSDGPRIAENVPTVFLGARGCFDFELVCHYRDGAYHSGNWGGLLENAGIRLAHALSCITDAHGKILIDAFKPKSIPQDIKDILAKVKFERGVDAPKTAQNWGEPHLTEAEQVFAWCNFEVLDYVCGQPKAPVNAIPGIARAHCQLRYVVGTEQENFIHALRQHLDNFGFQDIKIITSELSFLKPTRTDINNPWVAFAVDSIYQTTQKQPTLLPNLGGSLPNDVFVDILSLPTIWIPHSHPLCGQHAPNEHMLLSVAREGMAIMAGLFFDLSQMAKENGQTTKGHLKK